jgi:hypothetical protein
MEASKGVWGDERPSLPISESDIRKWAIASYWPERPPRLFWDQDVRDAHQPCADDLRVSFAPTHR